jgi:hypothetical protein
MRQSVGSWDRPAGSGALTGREEWPIGCEAAVPRPDVGSAARYAPQADRELDTGLDGTRFSSVFSCQLDMPLRRREGAVLFIAHWTVPPQNLKVTIQRFKETENSG